MNADLTFNTIVFKKSFDEKDNSLRQSTARGINIPDQLIVKNQDFVDSATKKSGKRYLIRVDRHNTDVNGLKYVTSAQVVLAVPADASQADIDNVVATLKAAVADAALIPAVLNKEL